VLFPPLGHYLCREASRISLDTSGPVREWADFLKCRKTCDGNVSVHNQKTLYGQVDSEWQGGTVDKLTVPSTTVIPAYPYEGAFFWFIAAGRTHSTTHPYYRVLYGPESSKLQVRAAALTCLFPNVVLAGADSVLPDQNRYLSDRDYFHPDLRISLSWRQNERAPENRAIARMLLHDDLNVKKLLMSQHFLSGDLVLMEHFLCRVALQVRLAVQHNATLIGDEFFQKV
jgi:hypothetical protein